MKTLKELKQVAEKKGLRYEVNILSTLNKIEIGIEYRSNIWAWWDSFIEDPFNVDENIDMFFRETYNCICGRQNKTFKRGFNVELQLFGE